MILYPGIPPLPLATALEQSIADQFARANAPADMTADGEAALKRQKEAAHEVWGIYNAAGKLALEPDTIVALDYSNEWRLSDFPIEKGGFSTYNRVGTPYGSRVRMSYAGSSAADRKAFLGQVDALFASMNLFSVVTPETTYTNATLERQELRRDERNGAAMITVDLLVREIRVTATARYNTPNGATPLPASQVQQPSAASTVSQGQVQATPPSASTQQQLALAGVA